MKISRFSPEQITKILKDYENGTTTDELCRVNGVSRPTFYKWRSKYAGMESADLKRLKLLEEENSKMKRMCANLALELDAAKYIIEKKL